jgi:hypothetical protein
MKKFIVSVFLVFLILALVGCGKTAGSSGGGSGGGGDTPPILPITHTFTFYEAIHTGYYYGTVGFKVTDVSGKDIVPFFTSSNVNTATIVGYAGSWSGYNAPISRSYSVPDGSTINITYRTNGYGTGIMERTPLNINPVLVQDYLQDYNAVGEGIGQILSVTINVRNDCGYIIKASAN